ncbi:hypothetical protein LTR50_006088 [Elasticomyces elasticus]|nr:hypothetical protein LTR50_006088 [Elasticomyces elasticus]
MYSCANNRLVYPPTGSAAGTASGAPPASSSTASASPSCSNAPTTLHLSDPPYENYFYSDCHGSSQVVVTSPLPDSNLTIIGPRLLVAWPAGNSGVVAFFQPQNGVNGSLGIQVQNSSSGALQPVYVPANSSSGNPFVGVSGMISFNTSATLTVAILGSIRTIRDFTEGPSILIPKIQSAISVEATSDGGVMMTRLWLDNITTTILKLSPASGGQSDQVTINNKTASFSTGTYSFSASFNYPQLQPLSATKALNAASQGLIAQNPDQTTSLSFLSYTTKLLAGAWRFLTYFGRDSMISLLLLQPVLSEGEGGAIEAVIAAVLERINQTDGSVAHEETIGDYSTYLNLNNNITSTAPQYDYKMVDSDYYLPIAMNNYFVQSATGRQRTSSFLSIGATVDPANQGLKYGDLALINAEKIMNTSAAFAATGGQTMQNLIHLKEGEIVGEWRDSTYGIGGGRIPYDVNTALVPAALRAIAALSAAGFYSTHPDWNTTASSYAKVWEDNTLKFFEVTVSASDARSLVQTYVTESSFAGPSNVGNITSDVVFHGLALDGNNGQSIVRVMNTDDCFRLFLLNSTNQTQLTSFVDQAATHIRQPFPVGLSTSVGLLVANPAYGGDPIYAANFTNNAYHGTVVWSWQLSMMAAGLQRQLARCTSSSVPDFCTNTAVHSNVLAAYNHLWDLIDANRAALGSEVWSWIYRNGDYHLTPLGALPPPAGQNPTGM